MKRLHSKFVRFFFPSLPPAPPRVLSGFRCCYLHSSAAMHPPHLDATSYSDENFQIFPQAAVESFGDALPFGFERRWFDRYARNELHRKVHHATMLISDTPPPSQDGKLSGYTIFIPHCFGQVEAYHAVVTKTDHRDGQATALQTAKQNMHPACSVGLDDHFYFYRNRPEPSQRKTQPPTTAT